MAYKVLDHRGSVVASSALDRKRELKRQLSAYRGAGIGRTTVDWSMDPGSADATLLPERWQLIWRIRERMRNDPIMRGALTKIVDSVIGPRGFSTSAQIDHDVIGISEDQARDIEADIDNVWEEWQEDCDYSGNPARTSSFTSLLSLRYNNEITTGEDLALPRYVKRPWSRFSFCIQVMATDRVCNPAGSGLYGLMTGPDGEDIRDGVHVGARGETKGIYVSDKHPYMFFSNYGARKVEYIPAINRKTGRVNFWHNYQVYRPEATRGEPAFACCLMGFRALSDYLQDEVTRAHMTTMFGLAITREEAFDPDSEGLADEDKVGNARERDEAQLELSPAMVHYLEPGEKADVIQANIPGAQFDSFTDKVATWSASPLGLPREDILNNFAGMNFSSSKASRVSSQRGKKKTQDYIIERYIEPIRALVIEEAYLRGYLRLPGFEDPVKRRAYLKHVTHPAPWQDLEPVKEETASKLRLANKTTSLTRECAMRGINLRTLLREWQREKQEFERAGLPLPAYLMEPPDPMAKAPGAANTPPTPPQAGGNKAKETE